MADWVTGKVTKVHNWTDALFSLTVRAPVHPFTAGQFTKLGLEIDGERVQRARVQQPLHCKSDLLARHIVHVAAQLADRLVRVRFT